MNDPRLSASLDALRVVLADLPADGLTALIGELEGLKAQAWARLIAQPAAPESAAGEAPPNMTAAELAAIYRVPRSWFYEQVRRGRLPCLRLGHYVRFDRADVAQALAGRR